MVALNFDASTVAPEFGIDAIPTGWYSVSIDESQMKPTRDGTGAYLQLRFNVLQGQYSGRKIFCRLNLQNSNEMTVQIAKGQLSAIAHSVGVVQVQDSSQLHGRPMKIKVVKKPASNGYEATNEVTGFRDINYIPDGEPQTETSTFPKSPVTQPVPTGWGAPAQPVAQPAPVQPAPVAPAPVQPATPVAPAATPAYAQTQPTAQPWDQAAQPAQVAPVAQASPAPVTDAPVAQPAAQPVAQPAPTAAPVEQPAAPVEQPAAAQAVSAAQTAAPPWAS